MPDQHTKNDTEEIVPVQGIMVPLDLPEFQVLEQRCSGDGKISTQVIARRSSLTCPSCQQECKTIHDCRVRVKRDIRLREYQVQLLLHKRRFACRNCHKTFTEADVACGRRRRTTRRLRESIGKHVVTQTVAQVSHEE
ncbi:MAG TPA: transposase family protein [Ktedonobacteraceae bacterium]|nr:transposase family protein [Ktedonobacteraceae bacterium]